MSLNKACLILTTTDSLMNAEQIASNLIEMSLAACVQIDKINSYYKFDNKLNNTVEYRLSIKTISSNYQDIENFLKCKHSYKLPQIVSLDIKNGLNDYLQWISDSCCK